MVCDAAQREASRQHIGSLLRDHHLPQPDTLVTHFRIEVGQFRIRWELHTEFVTWTFMRDLLPDRAGDSTHEPQPRH